MTEQEDYLVVLPGKVRHPMPDDLTALCHSVAERVCDAIEHGRAIGFDFMDAVEDYEDLRDRIKALRERLGVKPDPEPFPSQPIFPLAHAVVNRIPGEEWRTR